MWDDKTITGVGFYELRKFGPEDLNGEVGLYGGLTPSTKSLSTGTYAEGKASGLVLGGGLYIDWSRPKDCITR